MPTGAGRRADHFARRDKRKVRALSRDPARARGFGRRSQPWQDWNGREPRRRVAVRGADAVVHLAGEPVFGGLASRLAASAASARAASTRPASDRRDRWMAAPRGAIVRRTFVCASAVGYYGVARRRGARRVRGAGRGLPRRGVHVDWESRRRRGGRAARRPHGRACASASCWPGRAAPLPRWPCPSASGLGGRLGSGEPSGSRGSTSTTSVGPVRTPCSSDDRYRGAGQRRRAGLRHQRSSSPKALGRALSAPHPAPGARLRRAPRPGRAGGRAARQPAGGTPGPRGARLLLRPP